MHNHRRLCVASVIALGVIVLVAVLYLAGWLRQAGDAAHRSHFKTFPCERMRYDVVSWVGKTGSVEIEVSPLLEELPGPPAYRIVYTLQTTPAVSAVYAVKGQMSVLVDAGTLLPREYEERMTTGPGIMGGHNKHNKFVYNQVKHELLYYKEKDKQKGLELRRTRQIPPNAQHFGSLLYFLRYAPLKPGDDINIVVSGKSRDETTNVSVLRHEDYVTPDGRKGEAIALKADSNFGKEEMEGVTFLAWLDKSERFLVRLDAKTKWGTISARLVKRTVLKDAALEADESSGNHTGKIQVDTTARKAAP